jgi:hypothetical protein
LRTIILYRGVDFEKEELSIASKYFTCINRRPEIKHGDLVIGRYSLWPFYSDQEKDIEYVGAKLINNYHQHLYIADLQNYVADLQELTPRTWDNLQNLPENMSFVLKGETNSRKSNWKHDMFASNKKEAIEVYGRLANDSLIGYQKIYIREYVPLIKYLDGINDMPVTKEFRFFVAYGKILCGDYYWQNYIDDLPEKPKISDVPLDFLQKVINRVGNKSNFYVIDVGQRLSGEWVVIELNDGQQSGLPGISCAEDLYSNLSNAIGELK